MVLTYNAIDRINKIKSARMNPMAHLLSPLTFLLFDLWCKSSLMKLSRSSYSESELGSESELTWLIYVSYYSS